MSENERKNRGVIRLKCEICQKESNEFEKQRRLALRMELSRFLNRGGEKEA